MKINQIIKASAAGIISLGTLVGCASNAGTGALAGGAATGAVIGHNSHGNTAGGALVGGALGAIGGALVGNEIDQQQHEQREQQADRNGPAPEPYYDNRPYYYRDYPRGYYEVRRYDPYTGRMYIERHYPY